MTKLTTEEFIERARAAHGDKYDYSKARYRSLRIKLVVICQIHGEFEQQPRAHLSGAGCRKCSSISTGERNTLSNEEFIRRSTEIHQSKYDYTKSKYSGSNRNVMIICPLHGEFAQKPSLHFRGHGCKKCQYEEKSKLMILSLPEFLARATACHGDRYDYSECEYKSMSKYVYPICKFHGKFKQRGHSHTIGNGCPKCSAWHCGREAEGYLYVLQSLCGKYIKVGVGNDVTRRIAQYQDCVPFAFGILHSFRFKRGGAAFQTEEKYHGKLKSSGFSGFDGCSEWFLKDHKILSELVNEASNA